MLGMDKSSSDTIIKLFLELFWELRTIILVCLIVFVVFMIVLFVTYCIMVVVFSAAEVGFIMSLILFPPVSIAGLAVEGVAEVTGTAVMIALSIFITITVVIMLISLVIAIILIIIVMLMLHLVYIPLQDLIAIDPAVLHFPSSTMYIMKKPLEKQTFLQDYQQI